jgi:hypothetical protein
MTLALDSVSRKKHAAEEVKRIVASLNPQRLAEIEIIPKFTPYVGEILSQQ